MKLIIVRHGETDANAEQIIQGQTDTELNEKGKEQAKKAAFRFKNEKIDAIFSSDLTRTKQTAAEIARFHNIPIQYTKELRERNYGSVEMKTKDEYYDVIEKSGKTRHEFKPDGGESFKEVMERAKKFLKKMRKYEGKTGVIVSHGGFIRMLLGVIMEKPVEEADDLKIFNTAVSIIEADKEHIINCTKHLQ